MNAPPRRREPLAGGSSAQSRDNDTAKNSTGRPVFQGNAGNDRNKFQQPPAWPEPPGADAARMLVDLLRKGGR